MVQPASSFLDTPNFAKLVRHLEADGCAVHTVPDAGRLLQDMGTRMQGPRAPARQAELATEQARLQDVLTVHASEEARQSSSPAVVLCEQGRLPWPLPLAAAGVRTATPSHREQRPTRVASTGGPCGGKTTAQSYLRKVFTAEGYAVFTVPEAATLMGTMGTQIGRPRTAAQLLGFQSRLMALQCALEDHAVAEASGSERPALVLCDRGLADAKGFLKAPMWTKLLEHAGLTEADIHGRYDLVVHWVTAAVGAEQFYGFESNPHRCHDAAHAVGLDKRVQDAWSQHPMHRVVPNGGTFEEKLEQAAQVIRAVLPKSPLTEHGQGCPGHGRHGFAGAAAERAARPGSPARLRQSQSPRGTAP